jgi:Fe-S-cluster-containing dehydrogenase component/DMSO reductase anchor subunit
LLSAVDPVGATPIDHWIAAQSDLSAVERFSQRHADETLPVQARYYRELLPARPPGPGQQYAFAVDLDACTGCKACVAACHSLNGLDAGEQWRKVTVLTGVTDGRPFQQHVTAACHHCAEPACLDGCPVDAYEKDPVTGIVRHLDDQCIGCSYCTLTCPYEVPVFDHHRGIVRKCDLCTGRLAVGEAPACVQGCPNGAIQITVVDVAALTPARDDALVPGASPSAITSPATQYTTRRDLAGATDPVAAGARPATAHPPLALMLVLTQVAVGAFIVDLVLRGLGPRGVATLPAFDAVVVVAAGALALAASVLHLGRPLHCYRAVLGLRHSWLSREVVAFGAFTGLAVPYAALLVLADGGVPGGALRGLGVAVAATGAVGVACSVLIYTRTRRESWSVPSVAAKFTLTAAIGGVAGVLWLAAVAAAVGVTDGFELGGTTERVMFLTVAVLAAVKLAGEAAGFRHLGRAHGTEGERRARLLTGALVSTTRRRFAIGVVGGVLLPLAAAGAVDFQGSPWIAALLATAVLGSVVVGELHERTLFFTAASAPR